MRAAKRSARGSGSHVVFEPIMRSRSMREVDRTLRAIAPRDVSVSIVGESGTGKEVLARRLHDLSSRRSGPFIPLNCAAVPEALFESELFGHEKGSFTGATERMRGKIEPAHGGTLFLDEIGDMPLAVQSKVLRFLENQKFMRVGGSEKVSVDVRIVSATLRPLDDEVKAGRFRADLYYRIQGIQLEVPPLRQRGADLVPLVRQLLAQLSARHGLEPVRMSRQALALLRGHPWPGNIRELRNVLELLAVLRPGRRVRAEDLPAALRANARGAVPTGAAAQGSVEVPLDQPLSDSIAQIIAATLALENGNRTRAARRLGISTRTVQRHLSA
ncbi:MAG TPA: sigma-54 dependent transcriptional regulator, partial [Polyangiaceae bacterium]|nr:sigma-54 dependent transcriptional regulator [Polyangiaceae bacterium]